MSVRGDAYVQNHVAEMLSVQSLDAERSKLPMFLDLPETIDLHDRILDATGGRQGVINLTLVESALDAPLNDMAYGKATCLEDVAGSLLWHLARAHGFMDGNKRTAFAAMDITIASMGAGIQLNRNVSPACLVYAALILEKQEFLNLCRKERLVTYPDASREEEISAQFQQEERER